MQTRSFSSPVEPYASWSPVERCDPVPKAGAVAFRDWVIANLGGKSWGISRECDQILSSRHMEGRAWDWHPPTPEHGRKLVECLTSPDQDGNPNAWARRAGLRVIIWEGLIWTSGTKEWRPYPKTGSRTITHHDHVHFTWGWPGALGQTSFFTEVASPDDDGLGELAEHVSEYGDVGEFYDDAELAGVATDPPELVSMWGVRGIENTSNAFRAEVVRIGRRLGLSHDLLMAVMSFETAATFDPAKRSGDRPGAAVGLIQFTTWAKKVVGKTKDELAAMTAIEQLAYVEEWFRKSAPARLKRPQDYYFAVIGPECLGKDDSHAIYVEPSDAYRLNSGFDRNRDGQITCGEIAATFVGFANAQKRRPGVMVNMSQEATGSPIVGLLLAAGMIATVVAMEKT